MREKLLFLAVLFCLLIGRSNMELRAEEFTSVNPLIDVGDKVYVQHGTNEDGDIYNIYDLQKSDIGVTTVYENILPNFTSGKVWTRSGVYMDNVVTGYPHAATAPEDYIPVTAGDNYFIKAYGVGGVKVSDTLFYYYAPVLFLDDNDNVIGDALYNMLSKSKKGVMFTVPEGATKMHLTMFNHQSFTLQKELNLTDEEFDSLTVNKEALENEINQKYEAYKQDQTLYKRFDKAYITFVNDDTPSEIDQYGELFISKNIPLVLATIPENLIEEASSLTDTRLQAAKRIEEAGGEIMAHNGGTLKQEDLSDYNKMYSYFVKTKQLFNYYDLDVNGIILAGGSGQVVGAEETERWASSIYSYSDLYGMQYDKDNNVLESTYYHYRCGLGGFGNDVDKIKKAIDDAIENQTWTVFYFHNTNEISLDVLSQVLDYVNSKDEADIEAVTYKEMYQMNAAKESEVINTKKTFYVSETGTSRAGVSKEAPMSYETANHKKYLSGDTILFKRGDTFYGTFAPKIMKVDENITTLSAYGQGNRPTITAYKLADSENAWQLHEDGIYKINLTDTQYFSGLSATDEASINIGFLEDANGVKYYNRIYKYEDLQNEYDFHCDGTYLYLKCDENPYQKLGTLKLAPKVNLVMLHSNMKIKNLRVSGTGAHGLLGAGGSIGNIEISKNVIEDIGGSYLYGNGTRYGNGIEFYGTNVSNLTVKSNIIRNTYDVGFTIQGTEGSGTNVALKGNVFVNNSQDSEIWESGNATGIHSYEFTNNISVNAGRGWGYEARPDKYVTAHILFWQYLIEDTDIFFHHNTVYNPRRIYFIEQTNKTNIFFQEKDYIKSDYNTYFMAEDATIFRDTYKINAKDDFISAYKKDQNSEFTLIEPDDAMISEFASSDDIVSLKAVFGYEEEPDDDDFTDEDDNREEDNKEEEGKTESVSGNELEVVEEAPSEIRVEKIVISAPSKKLAAGKKVQLGIEISPVNATNSSVTWKSSKPKYATVSRTGKVTLKKAGIGKTVTITAEALDGSGVKATYKIKIMKHAVKKITLTADKKTVKAGKSIKLKATVTTTGESANKALKWTSSNTKYATVSKSGKVTTKKAGKGKTVTITATATDGSAKKAKIKIKIK